MIAKTLAIPLRITAYSNTSRIVTWISREMGLVTTMLKGALRPKSAFIGQYDLGQTSELLFYRRERNGMHIGTECALVTMRSGLRDSWRGCAVAGYMADLTLRTAVHDPHQGPAFAILETALDALNAGGDPAMLLLWYELKLSGALGFAPQLKGAASADVVAILTRWQEVTDVRPALALRCHRNQRLALKDALAKVLLHYLDRLPDSRQVAWATLCYEPGDAP